MGTLSKAISLVLSPQLLSPCMLLGCLGCEAKNYLKLL